MKPLATPVLGGMLSSLVHVLIVTPVIFFWLRERQLGLQHEAIADVRPQASPRRAAIVVGVLLAALAAGSFAIWRTAGRGGGDAATSQPDRIVQTVRSGDLEIDLRAPGGALRQGRNTFTIEFRREGNDALIDVGTVGASANMAMPGMVMSGGLQVIPSGVPGRYTATASFGMAGAWQMAIEWDGPAGRGSVNFQGSVQ
jgi:Cu(I)/Ag(I) efflux system membrane protein CusA/SilA